MKQHFVLPSQLSPFLISARRTQKLSQTALAARLDISQSRMSYMELHPESINLDQLLTLCGALGLELVIQSKDTSASSQPHASGDTTVEW